MMNFRQKDLNRSSLGVTVNRDAQYFEDLLDLIIRERIGLADGRPASEVPAVPFPEAGQPVILIVGLKEATSEQHAAALAEYRQIRARHPSFLMWLYSFDTVNESVKVEFDKVFSVSSPILSVIECAQIVYTHSILGGFDAALHGKDVILLEVRSDTSEWILGSRVDGDIQKILNGSARDMISHAASLDYPSIMGPERVCFEEAFFYALTKKMPGFQFLTPNSRKEFSEDIAVPASQVGGTELLEFFSGKLVSDLFSPTGRFLHTLQFSARADEAVRYLLASVPAKDSIELLPRIVTFMKVKVRYVELAVIINLYFEWFSENSRSISIVSDIKFYQHMSFSIKHLNGRQINPLPEYKKKLARYGMLSRMLRERIVRVMSGLCEYQGLEKLFVSCISVMSRHELGVLRDILLLGPAKHRSEKDYARRREIISTIESRLQKIYSSKFVAFPNNEIFPVFKAHLTGDLKELNRAVLVFSEKMSRLSFVKKIQLKATRALFLKRWSPVSEVGKVIRSLLDTEYAETASRAYRAIRPYLTVPDRKTLRDLEFASMPYEGLLAAMSSRPSLIRENGFRRLLARKALTDARFGDAEKWFSLSLAHSKTPAQRLQAQKELDKATFLKRASEISLWHPQPKRPKGVVFLASLTCFNTLALIAPVLQELRRQGYAVIHLSTGMMVNPKTGIPEIDRFVNSLPLSRAYEVGRSFTHEWKIDWPNRVVSAQGINFYQGIYERLSINQRRFHVDTEQSNSKNLLNNCLLSSDLIINICSDIHRDIVQGLGMPVILIGSNSHISPYSAFRDYVLDKRDPNMRYVLAGVAYENYYTNLGKMYSGSMAFVDRSLHTHTRMPFLAVPERFERWYQENRDNPEVTESVNALIKTNRVLKAEDAKNPLWERFINARAEGKKIICCFGKILCDLGVPFDGGPAHSDIVDWINHTIEIAERNPDILLIIKPHPHEQRAEIALDLAERLIDVIPKTLPDNVVVLGYKDFNVHEIASVLDLAILWNGTSSLELTSLGVPVMMCAYFGQYDYPVDLLYPKGRLQYEEFLRDQQYRLPSEDLKIRAGALLYYMGSKEVALPNTYSFRASTNDDVGIPRWNEVDLIELEKNGDSFVVKAADLILEGLKSTDQGGAERAAQ